MLGAPGSARSGLVERLHREHAASNGLAWQLGLPAHVELSLASTKCRVLDLPARGDFARNAVSGGHRPDLVVALVDAERGVDRELRRDLRLAMEVGALAIVVVVQAGSSPDAQLVELARVESRTMLDALAPPVGQVLVDDVSVVGELLGTFQSVPAPSVCPTGPVWMAVEEYRSVRGRGTTVSGQVRCGGLRVNEHLELVGVRERQSTSMATEVTELQVQHQRVDEAWPGDATFALLRGVDLDQIARGHVIATPGFAVCRRDLEADVYVLTAEEGGPDRPLHAGQRVPCDTHGVLRSGMIVSFESGSSNRARVSVKLDEPAVVVPGMHFVAWCGGGVAAIGRVRRADA